MFGVKQSLKQLISRNNRFAANFKLNNILKREFAIQFSKNPLISVDEAYQDFLNKEKKNVFIDVRDTESFISGHIPNAHNINEIFTYLSTSDKAGIEAIKAEFNKVFQAHGLTGNENIILYESCLKTRFGASCRGSYLFNLFGYQNVRVLHGSWELWTKKGLNTSSEKTKLPEEKGSFQAKWNDSIFADKDDVLKAIEKKDTILLDVRDHDEWKGESSSPYGVDYAPRKGRIPGAIHIFWKDFMYENDGVTYLKSPEEILKLTKEKGITPDKNIIVYCFKGARASNTFIALRTAGFENIKNYFASWNEWSRDPKCPIDDKKI